MQNIWSISKKLLVLAILLNTPHITAAAAGKEEAVAEVPSKEFMAMSAKFSPQQKSDIMHFIYYGIQKLQMGESVLGSKRALQDHRAQGFKRNIAYYEQRIKGSEIKIKELQAASLGGEGIPYELSELTQLPSEAEMLKLSADELDLTLKNKVKKLKKYYDAIHDPGMVITRGPNAARFPSSNIL